METGVGKMGRQWRLYEEEISLSLWFCPHSVGPHGQGECYPFCPFRNVGELFKIWEWLGKREKVNPGRKGHGYVSSVSSLGLWAEEGGGVIPASLRLGHSVRCSGAAAQLHTFRLRGPMAPLSLFPFLPPPSHFWPGVASCVPLLTPRSYFLKEPQSFQFSTLFTP